MPSVESEPMRVRTLGERSEEKGLEGGLGGKEGRRFAMAPASVEMSGTRGGGQEVDVRKERKANQCLVSYSFLCFVLFS